MSIDSKPGVSVDCVVFRFDHQKAELSVLLVERKQVSGQESKISLPGDDVLMNEEILVAAKRVLSNQTGLKIPLYRFRSFENPDRLNRPAGTGRVISKGYLGFALNDNLKFGGLAATGRFYKLSEVPNQLLYDHKDILYSAIEALRKSAINHLIPLDGMPNRFTVTQVQQLYEAILGEKLDKRNFRRALLSREYLADSGELLKGQNFRPAKLYQFDEFKYKNCLDRELEKLPVVLF